VHIEHSVTIQRSAADVFNLVGNPNDDMIWGTLIVESEQLSPGPLGIGSQFRQIASLLGARLPMRIEVTDYEPGRMLRYRCAEPFPIVHCRAVEETPDGSQLTFSTEIDPGAKFRLAAPFLGQATRRQMEADLAEIKNILEASTRENAPVT
jgi:hypothetical protein